MKKYVDNKKTIVTIFMMIAIVVVVYVLYIFKAGDDSKSAIENKDIAQQKINTTAVKNQVEVDIDKKKIHASESTVHFGQPISNNQQIGRTLMASCSLPVQNSSDYSISVTVIFTITVFDSAWHREMTYNEVVTTSIMPHSTGNVTFNKSYSTAQFIRGNYEVAEVKEIFGKGAK